MYGKKHTSRVLLALAPLFLMSHLQAGQCDTEWASSSANASCTLLENPIPTAQPSNRHSDLDCVIHVKCYTGGTSPENSNSWNTREINNYLELKRSYGLQFVRRLVNCSGDLRTDACH